MMRALIVLLNRIDRNPCYLECHKEALASFKITYECKCGRLYRRKKKLTGHLIRRKKMQKKHKQQSLTQMHRRVATYRCPVCSKVFKRSSMLKCHIQVHINLAQHVGKMCDCKTSPLHDMSEVGSEAEERFKLFTVRDEAAFNLNAAVFHYETKGRFDPLETSRVPTVSYAALRKREFRVVLKHGHVNSTLKKKTFPLRNVSARKLAGQKALRCVACVFPQKNVMAADTPVAVDDAALLHSAVSDNNLEPNPNCVVYKTENVDTAAVEPTIEKLNENKIVPVNNSSDQEVVMDLTRMKLENITCKMSFDQNKCGQCSMVFNTIDDLHEHVDTHAAKKSSPKSKNSFNLNDVKDTSMILVSSSCGPNERQQAEDDGTVERVGTVKEPVDDISAKKLVINDTSAKESVGNNVEQTCIEMPTPAIECIDLTGDFEDVKPILPAAIIQYKCQQCALAFHDNGLLQEHLHMHLALKCYVCGRRLEDVSSADQVCIKHMHTGSCGPSVREWVSIQEDDKEKYDERQVCSEHHLVKNAILILQKS